jgi:hypothetical protein
MVQLIQQVLIIRSLKLDVGVHASNLQTADSHLKVYCLGEKKT